MSALPHLRRLSDYLKTCLAQRQMTQHDLAKASGLTVASVNAYVRGTRRPSEHNCEKLARALHVAREEVVGRAGWAIKDAAVHLDPDEVEFLKVWRALTERSRRPLRVAAQEALRIQEEEARYRTEDGPPQEEPPTPK